MVYVFLYPLCSFVFTYSYISFVQNAQRGVLNPYREIQYPIVQSAQKWGKNKEIGADLINKYKSCIKYI